MAVVDANPENIIVWQVDVSPNPSGLSRMAGAWVLAAGDCETLKSLVQARYLVATASGLDACRRVSADGYTATIDLSLTLDEVAAEIKRLQGKFEEAATASKSALVPPTWPKLPQSFEATSPTDPKAPVHVAVALGIARWLELVALAWESLEQQRLMRKYLRGEEEEQRRFPLVEARP